MNHDLKFGPLSLVMTLSLMAASAQAAKIDITSLTKFQGGAEIKAQYDLGANWDSDCCPPANIRWMQRVQLLDDKGADKVIAPPDPNFPFAQFIDPRKGQDIGGGNKGDDLPFYDVTYAKADFSDGIQRGSGQYFFDRPSGWQNDSPLDFLATTLLVCIDDATKQARYLAGFKWGFSVRNAGGAVTTSLINWGKVPYGAGLKASYDGLLDNAVGKAGEGFKNKWTLEAADPNCPEFEVVPEPASMVAMAVGLAGLVARRRRS